MSDLGSVGDNLQAAFRGETATPWSRLLYVTAIVYVVSGGIAVLPDGTVFDVILLVFLLVFLGCWLPFPLWLYKDRKRTTAETEYEPSKLYYLGWLPGYLGMGAISLYLYRRGRAYSQAEEQTDDEQARRQAERDAVM